MERKMSFFLVSTLYIRKHNHQQITEEAFFFVKCEKFPNFNENFNELSLLGIENYSKLLSITHESFRAKTHLLGPNEKFEIFRWMYRSAYRESNPLLFVIF